MSRSGTVAARHVWKRFRTDRHKPQLRHHVGELRSRLGRAERERWRWALRDLDFAVEPGDSVGLIGPNGSGKSTLLKVLTRVMYPYAGSIDVKGRVGALIEVKAGIHPELTGRENVYLYGTLLGLRRRQVAQRFDEIVQFAELDDAIDRQVKYFSSGMQMRLGFAVAAFLEPDILLVDEVLAVGDASFQQRCLDRMRTVLSQGTTLVFVSHDLAAVEAVCSRGLWLRDGVLAMDGRMSEVMAGYRQWVDEMAGSDQIVAGVVRLLKTVVSGEGDVTPSTQGLLDVKLVIESPEDRPSAVFIGISEGTASPALLLRRNLHLAPGETAISCAIHYLPLPRGRYYLWVGAFDDKRVLLPWHPAARFDVTGPDLDRPPYGVMRLAPVHVDATWNEVRAPS